MRLTDLLSEETIATQVQVQDKDALLSHMVSMIAKLGTLKDESAVLDAVLAREEVMSTGVGKGFACPHAKSPFVSETSAAFVTLKEPIEFASLDEKPVQMVFMLLGRESNVGLHLKVLSRVSRLVDQDSFREQVVQATSPQQVRDIISGLEANLVDV